LNNVMLNSKKWRIGSERIKCVLIQTRPNLSSFIQRERGWIRKFVILYLTTMKLASPMILILYSPWNEFVIAMLTQSRELINC
jgi:hypothetical protein